MRYSTWLLGAGYFGGILLAGLALPSPALGDEGCKREKEPIAADIQPEALWDGRKIVPFRALDNPKMVRTRDADFMDDSEYVLGVTVNGESRAYPTRFAWWHHVINDRIGDTPFVVTYCSVCNTGIRWEATVKGKVLKFDFYGLYNGVVTMCERETETVFLQVAGRGVKGSLTGTQLEAGPLLDTTWGEWKKLHPDTLVMSPDTPYQQYYRPKGKPEPRGHTRFPAPFFRPTVTRGDKRLPPFDKVLGVALSPAGKDEAPGMTVLRRAYPIKSLLKANGVVNDQFGNEPVAVFLHPETQTANAVVRRVDGKTLNFEGRQENGRVSIYDRETGSRWNVEGRAEAGPLAGKSLPRLQNHLSQWYGWVAYFPETTIFGRTDPPQPGDPFAEPGNQAEPQK